MKYFLKLFDLIIVAGALFFLGLFITDYSFVFEQGITNITGPSFGLAILLFLRYLLGKDSFKDIFLVRRLIPIDAGFNRRLLSWGIILTFVVLSALSIARHLSLSSGSFDLGIFDQAIWNTLNGDILFCSIRNNMNLLGDHFEPILLLIVPIYKIFPSVYVLLFLQSALLASGLAPLYLIAKDKIKQPALITVFLLSYMLSRPLRGVAYSDFHLEAFILPLLFWAYYFLVRRKNVLLWVAIALLLLTKEDTAFLVSGLGIFAFFAQKRAKMGVSLFFIGLLAWFLETKFIIPYFNPNGVFEHLNKLPFGENYQENLTNILKNPLMPVKFIFIKEKLLYCIKLFGPLGFMSILSPVHYILIGIPLIKNLLADPYFSGYYNITSHYTAAVLPFIYISAIYGAYRLTGIIKYPRFPNLLAVFIILCSLSFYGKTDAYKFNRYLKTIKEEDTLRKISYLKIVPDNSSVAASFNLVPHLSHRKYIYEWNPQNESSLEVDYLVIDLSLMEYLSKENVVSIPGYFNKIREIGYSKIFESGEGNFLIFRKEK